MEENKVIIYGYSLSLAYMVGRLASYRCVATARFFQIALWNWTELDQRFHFPILQLSSVLFTLLVSR